MIVIRAMLRVKPGKEDQAKAAFIAVMDGSQAEPGCLVYTFTSDFKDPAVVHVNEVWASQEDLFTHFQGAAFANFNAVAGDIVDPIGMNAWSGDMADFAFPV